MRMRFLSRPFLVDGRLSVRSKDSGRRSEDDSEMDEDEMARRGRKEVMARMAVGAEAVVTSCHRMHVGP